MGVEIEDAFHVASLIGTKVFADEFISFKDLVEMVCLRQIRVFVSLICSVLSSFTLCLSVTFYHRDIRVYNILHARESIIIRLITTINWFSQCSDIT